MRSIVIVVAFLAVASTSAPALAQARHERVKVTPVKAKGKIVGARVRAVLRPASGFNRVQMVLGKVEPGKYHGTNYREAAAGKAPGYVLHAEKQMKVESDAHPVEFTVKFDKKNGLKPGDKIDVTSVWAKDDKPSMSPSANNALHVWGMTRQGSSEPVTLPK